MRCPKCGFISFDHLDTCLKCSKDIAQTAEKIHGSVYNVAVPTFLKFNQHAQEDEELNEAFLEDADALVDEEIRDPDLDILLDEESGEEPDDDIEFSLGDDDEEVAAPVAEADDEIDFQLADFDDDADFGADDELAAEGAEAGVSLDLPEELSDMTDLGPPSQEGEAVAGLDEEFDFELSLDDEEPDAVAAESEDVDLADLALSDIGFDDEEPVVEAPQKSAAKKLNLDDDFDFELDLGDLKLDDDENL